METNILSSFSHRPLTFLPSLVPVEPTTTRKKRAKHTSNSNYSKIKNKYLPCWFLTKNLWKSSKFLSHISLHEWRGEVTHQNVFLGLSDLVMRSWMEMCLHYLQGSNFSAHGWNSAPGEADLGCCWGQFKSSEKSRLGVGEPPGPEEWFTYQNLHYLPLHLFDPEFLLFSGRMSRTEHPTSKP